MPQIAAAIRASVNRHTGFTPNKLILLREVNMPLEVIFAKSVPTQTDLPKENYVAHLQQDMLDSNQQTREVLKTSQKRMKVDHYVKCRKGDAVFICDRATIIGLCSKLRSPRKKTTFCLHISWKSKLKIGLAW